MPEGTLKLGFVLPDPMNDAPDRRLTLIADESPAGTRMSVEVDERLHFHYVRQAPGGTAQSVEVDATPLMGARRLDFWCVWSPVGMAFHVFDRDQHDRKVTGSIGIPP